MKFASGIGCKAWGRRLTSGPTPRRTGLDGTAWVVAGALAVLGGCGRSSSETEQPPAAESPLPPELAAIDGALGPGMELPPIRAEGWVNGPSVTNEDLLGSVAVVDVWAHW